MEVKSRRRRLMVYVTMLKIIPKPAPISSAAPTIPNVCVLGGVKSVKIRPRKRPSQAPVVADDRELGDLEICLGEAIDNGLCLEVGVVGAQNIALRNAGEGESTPAEHALVGHRAIVPRSGRVLP